jgi:N-acetyl-alpha-D-muramate 1-phosphate uridylyltransferase
VVCTGGEVGLSASAVTTAVPDTVMVFAAGLGTRMRPITATMPKPLVKIAGRTMIDHMLDRFADIGVKRAIVNVHYLAEQLEQHLAARNTPEIIISDERDKLLDQGGGIKKVLPLLGHKPFFICNTDAIWLEGARSNLALLRERWDPHAMDVLLLVAASATSVGVDWAGDFLMDGDGRLTRRREGQVAPFVYAGVGIIKPQLFAEAQEDVFRLAPYFFAAAERGRLFGHRLDGQWLHVGTPAAVEEAERAIARSAR